MTKNSLTIIGSGIKFMSHMTVEAKACIEKASKLLYLVNEPAIQKWLHHCNAHAESLEAAYTKYSLRTDTYQAITQSILSALKNNQHVCIVLEGHPVVFAKPALDAALIAKRAGIETNILPGISAEDYLFAELMIDPGTCGCQSYDATDFLIYHRAFDGCSHLILWQIGVIGMLSNDQHYDYKKAIEILINYLAIHYFPDHEIILFEGSQYPHIPSNIKKILLKELINASISRITTLYIPPIQKSVADLTMLKKLGISID